MTMDTSLRRRLAAQEKEAGMGRGTICVVLVRPDHEDEDKVTALAEASIEPRSNDTCILFRFGRG